MKPLHITIAALVVVFLALVVVWIIFFRSDNGIGLSRAPSKKQDVVRITTFDVEGLFGTFADEPSNDDHLTFIAEALQSIDADIVALQNVESLETVQWFADSFLTDLGYEYIATVEESRDSSPTNAVLSRYPIESSRGWNTLKLGGKHPAKAGSSPNKYAGQSVRFRHSPLMVRISLPVDDSGRDRSLTLFVLEHKGGNSYDYWRLAEAKAVVSLANDAGMDSPIIILGSFHAIPGDASIETYIAEGFMDAMGTEVVDDRFATETNGDRTDFILANRLAMGALDTSASFVLGGKLVTMPRETTHLPIVVELQMDHE